MQLMKALETKMNSHMFFINLTKAYNRAFHKQINRNYMRIYNGTVEIMYAKAITIIYRRCRWIDLFQP